MSTNKYLFVLVIVTILSYVQSECLFIKNNINVVITLEYNTVGLEIVSTANFVNISTVHQLTQQSYTYVVTNGDVNLYIEFVSNDMDIVVELSSKLVNGIIPVLDDKWKASNSTVVSCNLPQPLSPPVSRKMTINSIIGIILGVVMTMMMIAFVVWFCIISCIEIRMRKKATLAVELNRKEIGLFSPSITAREERSGLE